MKPLKGLLFFVSLLLIENVSQATSCRADKAAQIGSKMGYEDAKKVAQALEKRENQATRVLQQCLGSLSTSLTVPTFPDLSPILNGIKDKVCAAAREKISGYVSSNISPWEEVKVSDYSLPQKTFSATQKMVPDSKKSAPFSLN